MKQEKKIYTMPEMEVLFVSENNIYTIIGVSGNAPTMSQTPGKTYDDMFNF